ESVEEKVEQNEFNVTENSDSAKENESEDGKHIPFNPTASSSEETSFESLKESVSGKTLKAISDMGFTHMTEIQHKSIAPLLNG
ncbi:ATP-dependent RNA helicase DDX18, partial [Paramuricea clavata]